MKKILIAILFLLLVIIGGVTLWRFFSDHRTISSKEELLISSKEELLELFRMNFMDIEIADIQCEQGECNDIPYTEIRVLYNDSDEALQSREYYLEEKDFAPCFAPYLTPADISAMGKMGIGADSILHRGRNFKDYIAKSGEQRPYGIYWYELEKSYGYKGNVLILTSIDATIKIDVEKILND